MAEPGRAGTDHAPGLPARILAVRVIDEVFRARVALDETFERFSAEARLNAADSGLARAIATVALRRWGTIRAALAERLERGAPANAALFEPVLVAAASQILFMEVPDHAAVDLAIRQLGLDPRSSRYSALGNAVLRRIARERGAILAGDDAFRDTPDWLAASWVAAYGEGTAVAIAAAHGEEPALDLTVKADASGWAGRLDGIVLPTGSVRLRERQAVSSLPGFAEGGWWVQDAAAAIPARLLEAGAGDRVLDLCAAPGGKTAQLSAVGAAVTALDRSATRLKRLSANLARLGLDASVVTADASGFQSEPFPFVLLDAPCTATGTIRRHPDVAWTKTPDDLAKLTALQRRLLDAAARLTAPAGTLVYCTCSLQPEEGEAQIEAFLVRHPGFARRPIRAEEVGGLAEALTEAGDFRSLPSQLPAESMRLAGWAGFFASRLVRA